MPIVVGSTFECGLLPNHFAGFAVQRDYLESVFAISSDTVRVQKLLLANLVLNGLRAGNHWSFNRGCQEDAFAPDDWRRVATTRDWSFPLDVLFWTPGRGQVLFS